MYVVGIDVGKNSHYFSIMQSETGEIIKNAINFTNNLEGFNLLLKNFKPYKKESLLIGMEDTGHYHFVLVKFLLEKGYTVSLINPYITDLTRKAEGSITKNDELDTLTICDILAAPQRKKKYRIQAISNFAMYEQKLLTRHHHNLMEELTVLKNRLQRYIDTVFPEYNSLFKSKYGFVYMNILKTFGSASTIANTDIRTIRKAMEQEGRGKRISLTAEELKQAAKSSVGFSFPSDELQIRHLIEQIELIEQQIDEIDKKIEEFSITNNSPILTIPGISHFSGTSILAEYGDFNNYPDVAKVVKFAGVAPYEYKSSQYEAEHLPITKKGSRYLRKTLYQVIIPVINHNKVFRDYYDLKRSQGKSHTCALGHCVRKLLRVIYTLETTGQSFNPELLK